MVEKTSPPLPVEVGPDVSTSSASQVIAPTQVTGMMQKSLVVRIGTYYNNQWNVIAS